MLINLNDYILYESEEIIKTLDSKDTLFLLNLLSDSLHFLAKTNTKIEPILEHLNSIQGSFIVAGTGLKVFQGWSFTVVPFNRNYAGRQKIKYIYYRNNKWTSTIARGSLSGEVF